MEVYFGNVGVGGHFLWVIGMGRGKQRYILRGWKWVHIFYGWVGVGGGIIWVSGIWVDICYGWVGMGEDG